ncbi:MAG: BMP family protein [Actinobacteria bacterium]|nr:BMP family protein [Actinomycetota bacterium]
MLKPGRRVAAALLVFGLLLAGCGQPASNSSGSKGKSFADMKVAVVFLGDVSDGGYNSAAYGGLIKLEKDLGVQGAFSEVAFADIEQALRNYGAQGYDIVFAHSGAMKEAVKKVAPQFPKTRFVLLAGSLDGVDNVVAVDFKRDEIGFLAGVVAGTITGTNTVGIVQGLEFPSTKLIEAGFRFGVKTVNPGAKVLGAFTGTFDDVAKGKEAAMAQISQGADVLAHNAGWGGTGLIKAAEEKRAWAIGYPMDQNTLAPQAVVTSINLNFDKVMVELVKQAEAGRIGTGTVVKSIADGGLELAPFYGLVTPEQERAINDVIARVKDGKLKVKTAE